jgi:hypothetical protein
MSRIPPLASLALLLSLSPPSLQGEVVLKEDFEGEQHLALRLWATDAGDVNSNSVTMTFNTLQRNGTTVGEIETHYAGVTEKKAAGGRRSYKLDVTIPKGNMAYYDLPADLLFIEPLRLRGKLHVESDKPLWGLSMGFRYDNPNFGIDNIAWLGKKQHDLADGWTQWETYDPDFDPRDWPEPLQIRGLTIAIRGLFKDTRVTVHLDDIELVRMPFTELEADRGSRPIRGDYEAFPTKPITDEFILPTSTHIPGGLEREGLALTAAGDEFEPGSFVVLADKDLKDVAITVTPPAMGEHVLSRVNVRGVKCWWVHSIYLRSTPERASHAPPELVPHFLLNDDRLLQVSTDSFLDQQLRATDLEGRTKYYDITKPDPSIKPEYLVDDAPALLPVDIPALQPKQFWITVHVPRDTPPGKYTGEIRVEPANAPARSLPLSVTVLPFTLLPPSLDYSIYYRGKLTGGEPPVIGSDPKTERQLAAEFKNMKEHGVTNPNVYQGYGDDGERLAKYLRMREEAGMSKVRLFILGVCPRNRS